MTNRYKYYDERGQHLHTLDGRPLIGTSSVAKKVLAKPLAWYGSGQAVKLLGVEDGKLLTRIKNKKASVGEKEELMKKLEIAKAMISKMDDAQFFTLVDQMYREHDVYMRSRAKPGQDLHAELERFVKWKMEGVRSRDTFGFHGAGMMFSDQIIPFIKWSDDNVKRFLWSEGHCYSEKHWIGGICDVGYERNDGGFGIGDFKSTKDAYIDQFWQCAGYDIAISENGVFDADGNQMGMMRGKPFSEYMVFPFGAEKPEPKFYYDQTGGREAFIAMLLIYRKMPQE